MLVERAAASFLYNTVFDRSLASRFEKNSAPTAA
jgi:hypothetical protein